MTIAKAPALLLGLAAVVAAQSSVISVFFPGADEQTLLGSVIKSDASKTTMAVGCPTDVDANDCGFPTPITITVGPSTFYASEAFESTSAIVDCALTGTTAGVCAETYIEPADMFDDTDTSALTATDASSDTSITTTATTVTLSSTDITYIPITLTTGELQVLTAAGTGATGSESTPSATGTTSSSGSQTAASTSATGSTTGSTKSGTSTSSGTAATASSGSKNGASKGDSRMMACGAVGAGLVGLLSIMLF